MCRPVGAWVWGACVPGAYAPRLIIWRTFSSKKDAPAAADFIPPPSFGVLPLGRGRVFLSSPPFEGGVAKGRGGVFVPSTHFGGSKRRVFRYRKKIKKFN